MKRPVAIALVAVLYAVIGQAVAGAFQQRHAPILVWPSGGLALAAVIIDRRLWPGLIGSFIDAVVGGVGPLYSAYEAVGKVGAALVGAWILERAPRFDKELTHPRDFVWLAVGAMASAGSSAVVGISTLLMADKLAPSATLHALETWWQGDMLGILLVTPLILVWRQPFRGGADPLRIIEAAACFGLAFVFAWVIFLDNAADKRH